MNIELLSPNYNLMAPDVSPVAKEVLLSLGLKFEMIKKKQFHGSRSTRLFLGGIS
jgi:hypothetical protein